MLKNVEVLIVEDSPTQAMVLDDMLRGHGYRTTIARNAQEALAHLKEHLPTLVISDIVMPGVDGYELCRRIKADPRTRRVPVVLLTHLTGPEDIVRGLECGADNFFTKPYDEHFLISRIEYIVVNQEVRRGRGAKMGMEIVVAGKTYVIDPERMQILDLLFSTYETVVQRNEELRATKESLQEIARKVEHLHTVAMALGHCDTQDDACQLTVRAAADVLSFSQCMLSVVEGDSLVVKAFSGTPAEPVAQAGSYDSLLAWETYRQNRTMAHGSPKAWQARDGFASIISAPLGGFGVLQAVSEKPDAFSAEDTRLLDLLVGHAVAAVRRVGLQNQLREQAIRDPLTGLYNRYCLDEMLDREMKRSRRYGHTIGLLMIDVDKFKEINDRYGHLAGDWTLKAVSAHLRAQVRVMDSVVRYGGDEFLVIMPETSAPATDAAKRRILDELAKRNLRGIGLEFSVSISVGSAVWTPDSKLTQEELLAAADQAMYREKKRAK